MNSPKHKLSSLPPETSSVVVDVLKLIFLGLIFVIAAVSILWVNEWNNLTRKEKRLQDETAVVTVDPSEPVDFTNNGRLIYLTGILKAEDKLQDDWLNFEIEGLRLFRRVQIFEKHERAVLESYKGPGQWVDRSYVETPAIPKLTKATQVSTQSWHPKKANLEKYLIPFNLTDKITLYQKVNLKKILGLSGEITAVPITDDISNTKNNNLTKNASRWYLLHNRLYWGNLNRAPQAGDIRVDYFYLPNELEVSLISRQAPPNLVEPYLTKEGLVIERIQAGKHSWQELYPEGKPAHNWLVWTFRLLGWSLMWLGCWLMILPTSKFLKQLESLSVLQGFQPVRMSAIGGTLLSALVMSGAWIYYQPVWATTFAVCVLLIIFGIGFFYWRKMQITKNEALRLEGK